LEAPRQSRCGDLGIRRVDPAKRFEKDHLDEAEKRTRRWRGRRPEPVPSFSGTVEEPKEGKIGIACSGGGVRSAAFNLGALQSLQDAKRLQESCYLAAVSGGSYIAAAFCMVRKRWSGEQRPPRGTSGWDDSDPAVVDPARPPFHPGSPEEQYLRNRASYLAPGPLGQVKLGYRVFLGLLFNLGFVALFLFTLAIPLALFYGLLYPTLGESLSECLGNKCEFTPLAIPPGIYWPVIGLAALAAIAGLLPILAYRWSPATRDLLETWSLRLMIAALGLGALLIGLPILLSLVRAIGESNPEAATQPQKSTAAVGIGGLATVGGAVALQLRAEWIEVRKKAESVGKAAKRFSSLPQRLRRGLAYAIAAVIGPALAILFVLVVASAMLDLEQPLYALLYFVIALVFFAPIYFYADLTTWSLHPFYRRRLASAFALKRVSAEQAGSPPIAGGEDGVAEERDYDQPARLSETAVDHDRGGGGWPTLLVCAAANISDDAATPPGRAVTSFTFSAASVGGPLVGAVATRRLENCCSPTRRSLLTLPAVVAMSGAALSPSMGKMTRRPVRLLMGLANVRLGVWVPNPRRLEFFEQARRRFPRPRPSYLLRELFGSSPINAPYLYVTDGGHYDNLGVMELLRRGCTEVYCFDASNDDFDALGDLVSLARSELQVEIEFDYKPLVPGEDGFAEKDCHAGKIHYPAAPGDEPVVGNLYYARPTMTKGAPPDVLAHHAANPRFPRDPTADQLYTDQRFEAYRALGLDAGKHMLELPGAVA
jgi:hypothetical protein